jgi:tubby-related protein 1
MDDLHVKPVLGKPSIESSMTIDWKNAEQKRHFLMNPCPKNGMTEFYIKRRKGIVNLLAPEYRVYLRTGHVFLMSSKKRPNKPTSNYLISMNYDQLKGSTGILGKLRANFLGSEYQIFDSGRNPKRVDPYFEETNVEDPARYELGAILYGTQLLRSGEPRSMKVCISKVMDDDNMMRKKWQPAHRDEEMIRCFKHQSVSAKRHLHAFTSKCHPKDADQEEILRNFQGRVTLSSVKNFQLVGEEDGKLVMQFGRVDKDEFIMDVRWPMSPFQAFAIALSACDTKIACGD